MVLAFDKRRWETLRKQRGLVFGAHLEHKRVTDSTNDDALELARQGAPQGAVVVADTQRRGRGRRNSHWFSEPGHGLTFSLIVQDTWPKEMLPFLPLVVGLGVREVVAGKVAAPVLIKWPNDVLAGERKIAGILLESLSRAGSIRAVVIGVGLNVRTRRFPHELVDAATSLLLLGAADLSLEPLLADLLAAFERRFHELASVGFEPQWRELNRVDALRGTKIRVDERVGIASGIDKNGALTLLVDGQKQPVWVGHVVPVTASEC